MTDSLQTVAKAIAALLTPFVVFGVAKLADWVGMPTPDHDIITAVVVAVVSALVVWAVPNKPKPEAP